MVKIITLCLFLITLLSTPCLAESYSQLQNDFHTVSGQIIMPIGDEYLIDLDATSNLNEGDIVTLISAGEQVVHPTTKEVIGTIDIPQGFLRVTRIKSGYSYVKPITANLVPGKGDKVIRYEKVPTELIVKDPANAQTAKQIRATLAQLSWLEEGNPEPALLTFTLENNLLTVHNINDLKLYQYKFQGAELSSIYTPAKPSENVTAEPNSIGILNSAFQKFVGTVAPESTDIDLETKSGMVRRSAEKKAGVWVSPRLSGKAVGISVADFDGDKNTEIALAMRDRLIIASVNDGKYRQHAEVEIPKGLQLLALDSIDLNQNGRPELYITATFGENLRSFAVEYENGNYVVLANRIRWYLRAIDIPNSGKVLLGQARGVYGRDFIGQPFKVMLQDNEWIAGEKFELPAGVNLYGFSPLTDTDNNRLYAHLNGNDKLVISDEWGTTLWQSEDTFGGSLIMLDVNAANKETSTVPTFIHPRLLVNSDGEILVPQNYGQRISAYWRSFDNSRLVALKWNGAGMQESWSTFNSAGYLADFAIADIDNDQADEAVQLIQSTSGLLQKKTVVTIRSYELAQP